MTITVDVSGVARKVSQIMNDRGLGMFAASEAMKGMDKYVPYRDGDLARSAQASPFKVTYTEAYARYIYDGVSLKFSKEHHVLATAKWDKAWYGAHGDEYERAIERYIRRM